MVTFNIDVNIRYDSKTLQKLIFYIHIYLGGKTRLIGLQRT